MFLRQPFDCFGLGVDQPQLSVGARANGEDCWDQPNGSDN